MDVDLDLTAAGTNDCASTLDLVAAPAGNEKKLVRLDGVLVLNDAVPRDPHTGERGRKRAGACLSKTATQLLSLFASIGEMLTLSNRVTRSVTTAGRAPILLRALDSGRPMTAEPGEGAAHAAKLEGSRAVQSERNGR